MTTKRFPSVCVSNFQPIYRSVCRLAGKGDKRIGIIGGLPRLSSTQERIAAYQEAVADCGLPQDEAADPLRQLHGKQRPGLSG